MLFLLLVVFSATVHAMGPSGPSGPCDDGGTYGSLSEVPVIGIDTCGHVVSASTVPADTAATPDTYVVRDANASTALGSLALVGTFVDTSVVPFLLQPTWNITAAGSYSVTGGLVQNMFVSPLPSDVSYVTVSGLSVTAIGSNAQYSTSAISFVTGVSISKPDLGLGPMTANTIVGLAFSDTSVPCVNNWGIRIGTISGGNFSNRAITTNAISGAGAANAQIYLAGVSGAAQNTGISVSISSGGIDNVGVRIPAQGASTGSGISAALYLSTTTTTPSAGIRWTADSSPTCNLYRISYGTLRTDGVFHVKPFRIAAVSLVPVSALIASTQWNHTTATTATSVGVIGTNSLSGPQLATNGISTFVIDNGGTGYALNDLLTVSGGSGTAQVKVTSVSTGIVLTVVLTRPGSGYSIASGVALTGGSGSGATLNITAINSTPFTALIGVQGQGFEATNQFTTPTVTTAISFQAVAPNLGSGPVTLITNVGLDIPVATVACTNSYGIRVARPNGGSALNQAIALIDTTGSAAGGLTFGSDASPATNLYRSAAKTLRTDADFAARKHYTVNAALPTATVGTGAGTGATATVAAGSTDCKMQISVTTGSAPAALATIFTLTYNAPFINALNAGTLCMAANAAATTAAPYVGSETLASFKLNVGAAALSAATTYVWNCQACT